MTRTVRTLPPNDRWLRKIRTTPLIKNKLKAEQEIREELGPNYLGGNMSEKGKIPTYYDDLYISSYAEYKSKKDRYEQILVNRIPQLENKFIFYWFDIHKNMFAIHIYKPHFTTPIKYITIPFNIKIKNKLYLIKLINGF